MVCGSPWLAQRNGRASAAENAAASTSATMAESILMSTRGYLRQPSIAADAIVFVCDDDLWRVDAAGGVARRLTAGLGEVGAPSLSPDGRWLAYVARDAHHPEFSLLPADARPPRRLILLLPP